MFERWAPGNVVLTDIVAYYYQMVLVGPTDLKYWKCIPGASPDGETNLNDESSGEALTDLPLVSWPSETSLAMITGDTPL